ncbi:MAG: hypothetical protein V4773_17635 [Verrucomicrobiota bacterium]
MSEWILVLALFWAFWAIDGARLLGRRVFSLTGRLRRRGRRGMRLGYSRLSLPAVLPHGARVVAEDVPLAFSPEGICNRPVGSAGRPAEEPERAVQAWRWEEIKQVGLAKGWIYVNGARFCPATGHVMAAEVLALTEAAPAVRERRLQMLLRRWFRPAHLRRKARVLEARTAWPAALNGWTLAILAGVTIYVGGDFAARLSAEKSARLADALPWILLGASAMHLMAVIVTWRALRRLRAVRPEKRSSSLMSALLLPAQALRLRALAGDGFFPAQHPLAAVLAFAGERVQRAVAFDTLADLRWPIHGREDSPRAREIAAWFRAALEQRVRAELARAGVAVDELLAAPKPDTKESCRYCPRCRAQFRAGPEMCPHGVVLARVKDEA